MIEIDGLYYNDIMTDYYDYIIYDKPKEDIRACKNAFMDVLAPIIEPVLDRMLKLCKWLRVKESK